MMRIGITIPPERSGEIRAIVADYALRFGITEEEAWRVLEERVEADFNRELHRLLATGQCPIKHPQNGTRCRLRAGHPLPHECR